MARPGIDWNALGDETVELMRRYLAIDTTNPPGNEILGARFLSEVLAREGIESEIAESAPGRANLVARLKGDGSLGGIVLHHHIDVVYADRRYWTVDPFGGVLADGYLYGRGALDMKSTGIAQLAAVLAIRRALACCPPTGGRAGCRRPPSTSAGSPACCARAGRPVTRTWRRHCASRPSARASWPTASTPRSCGRRSRSTSSRPARRST